MAEAAEEIVLNFDNEVSLEQLLAMSEDEWDVVLGEKIRQRGEGWLSLFLRYLENRYKQAQSSPGDRLIFRVRCQMEAEMKRLNEERQKN